MLEFTLFVIDHHSHVTNDNGIIKGIVSQDEYFLKVLKIK
jgi:hypothetical protein